MTQDAGGGGALPLAAIGALLTLFPTRTTLNIQPFVGCIMLGGIAVNNAILLTSLTTILALLPLALGVGEGAEARAPLALRVVGGLPGEWRSYPERGVRRREPGLVSPRSVAWPVATRSGYRRL